MKVNKKPFLWYIINNLKKNGLTDIILSVGYKKEKIKKYFKDGKKFGINISYSEEDEPLGTGGAIRKAIIEQIEHENEDIVFLIINGDTFSNIDYFQMYCFHAKKIITDIPIIMTMAIKFKENALRYGKVICDKNNKIIFLEEKETSASGFVNAGCYIVEKEIINFIDDKCSFEKDVFPKIISKGLYAFSDGANVYDEFIDIGIPEDYYKFCELMK